MEDGIDPTRLSTCPRNRPTRHNNFLPSAMLSPGLALGSQKAKSFLPAQQLFIRRRFSDTVSGALSITPTATPAHGVILHNPSSGHPSLSPLAAFDVRNLPASSPSHPRAVVHSHRMHESCLVLQPGFRRYRCVVLPGFVPSNLFPSPAFFSVTDTAP
jgi:hypothetical protein